MTEKIKEQIEQIRRSGRTNMLDVNTVQIIAHEMHFYDLVVYTEENRKGYIRYIFTGDEGD